MGKKKERLLRADIGIVDANETFPKGVVHPLEAGENLTFHIWPFPITNLHTHADVLELFIVTSGMLIHRIGEETLVMKTGDAYLVLPGQIHQHCQYENYTSQHINLTCAKSYVHTLCKAAFGVAKPQFPRRLVHFTQRELSVILGLQDVILKSTSDEHLNIAVRSLFSFALGYFSIPDREPEQNNTMPEWLLQFLHKLQDIDFSNPVSLSNLYAMSGYSQSTLSMYFKKYVGKTLVSYINDLKLNYACNLLKSTTFTLTEISRASGFESYPHFSRVFKKHFGSTPLQYRNSQTHTPT